MKITLAQGFSACSFVILVGSYGFLMQFEHKGQLPGRTNPALTTTVYGENKRSIYCVVSPGCGCSLSTIANLGLLANANYKNLAIKVVVFSADGKAASSYVESAVDAATAAKFEIIPDQSGAVARKLHATASGTTLFFDDKGACLFKGGITDFRGVQGESIGLALLRKYAIGAETRQSSLPILGCALGKGN